MASTPLRFPLTCGQGHVARCSVMLTRDSGWDIRVEMDESVVFARHCTEWHRVERICSQLKEQCWDECTGDRLHQ